jgi:hypothetical protein
VVDFEAAIWTAVKDVLPEVIIKGCAYHWTQAIYRKIQEVGLSTADRKDLATNNLCRRLMAMPLIPPEHIEKMFYELQNDATTNKLHDLFQYVERIWIQGTTWGPKTWSVFMEIIQTNNDFEGWHRRFHERPRKTD